MKLLLKWIYISVIFGTIPHICYSQKISKIQKPYILINIDQNSGIHIGDHVAILRLDSKGKPFSIGQAEILKFKNGKCAGRIISLNNGYRIKYNDFIQTIKPDNRTRNMISLVNISLGIVSAGVGYHYHSKANIIYSDYKNSRDSQTVIKLYDETIRYDKKSQISFGVSGGLIGFGILYYFLKSEDTGNYENKRVSFEPFQSTDEIGVHFAVSF